MGMLPDVSGPIHCTPLKTGRLDVYMVMEQVNSILGIGEGTSANPVSQAMIQWLDQQLAARRADYDRARKYYGGDHDVRLTDRLEAYLQRNGKGFADNFCEVVVDALAERLTVIGFSGADDNLNQYAWDTWQANRMDDTQVSIHTTAAMLGDAYVLVDWDEDNKRPRFTAQMPEMIIPHYNETTGQMDWLSKKWQDKPIGGNPETRLNLYFPERLEKYIASGSAWRQFMDEGDEAWPLPWVDKSGQPLGVTVLHFRNRRDDTFYGTSELDNVIPMQDLLNKTLVDLVMVLDTMGFGQAWTLNVDHEASHLNVVPGSVWDLHSDEEVDAQVGQWPASDPGGILKAIELIVQHVAGISRTPQYLFQIMGGAPSGESLKMAETGLVAKAKRRQVNFGNVWEDAIHMAAKLEATFGTISLAPDSTVETLWEKPESRNKVEEMAELEAKSRLGVSQKQIWRELGYNEDEITQMEKDKEEERVADTNLGGLLLGRFSRGDV